MRFKILLALCIVTAPVWAGTILSNVTTLSNFGNVYLFHSSTQQYCFISATGLSSNLVITAPNGFEVSTNSKHSYSSQVTITPVSGNVSNRLLYVRFSPSALGTHSGNLILSSSGSSSVSISLSGNGINWAIPSNYYSTVNTQRGAALKSVLYSKISGHTSVSYTPGVWNAYATTDVQANGKVWDIYSTKVDSTSPYIYTLGTDQCGSYSNEGDCYNREHTFPQSWFSSSSPMVSDLTHLFASDGKVNSVRNNYPFGNVSSVNYTSMYGGKRGTGSNFGYSGTVFEPIDEYKGDIARAFFYMATRYENLIAGWQNNGNANDVLNGTAYPAYDSWYINLLLSWHNLDPVSDKELKRNNAIYTIQNNRNPFIDSPQFAYKIWGGNIASEPTLAATNLSVTNISNTSVKLTWTSGNGSRRIVIVRPAAAISSFPVDTFNYTFNSNFAIAPQLASNHYVVYNGSGSSATITGLQPGVNYFYAVIEYNGWYNTSNYFVSGASSISAITLPVTWLNFSAKKIAGDKKIVLEWSTASERNNLGFCIERSEDGTNYIEIGFVKGKGKSEIVSTYSYIDNNFNLNFPVYYRLRQIDYDGSANFSDVVVVDELVQEPEVLMNYAAEEVGIYLLLNNPQFGEYVESTFIDASGKIVQQLKNEIDGNKDKVFIALDNYPAGVYILQVEYKNRLYRFKCIKY